MTTDLGPETLTDAVINSFKDTPNLRLKSVMESLTRHLHGFVKDVQPTVDEWETAIRFLTATGQKCDQFRQEFILLSDVLGVSMLVETINDAETPEATASTVLGPFHMVASPERKLSDNISLESEGDVCVVRGSIFSVTGAPVPGARIDVWQADTNGFYDVQQPGIQSLGNGRGLFTADENGQFNFRTVIPSYYPIPTDGPVGDLLTATRRHPNRPAHIHFIVTAPGYEELTTHIFVAGSPYIDSDAVFAVKDSLIIHFTENTDPVAAQRHSVEGPFTEGVVDIVLQPKIHEALATTTTLQESIR